MTEALLQTTVVNSLVAASGAGLVWLAARSGLRPAWLHLLWLAVLLRLVMPPCWPVEVLPPFRATAPAPAALGVDSFMTMAGPSEGRALIIPFSSSGEATDATVSLAVVPPTRFSATWWRDLRTTLAGWPWADLAGGLWLVGVVAWWALAWRRLRRFHRALTGGETIPSRLCDAAGVPLRLIDARVSPCLWAFAGRAWIAFPRELYETLPAAERELILRHELAHYHRRDHWVRWVECAVLSLQWWNPLAWWITRRLREAEEAACDAHVAAAPGERRAYATALVRTADFLLGEDTCPAPRLASGAGSLAPLKRRLQAILEATPPPRRTARALLLLLSAGVVLAVTPTPKPPAVVTAEFPLAASAEIASELLILEGGNAIEAQRKEQERKLSASQATDVEAPLPIEVGWGKPAVDATPATPAEAEAFQPVVEPPPLSESEGKAPKDPAAAPKDQTTPPGHDAEGLYLKGYMQVLEAEKLTQQGLRESALMKYRDALKIIEEVVAKWPKWQLQMVNFRRNLIKDKIAALASSLEAVKDEDEKKKPVDRREDITLRAAGTTSYSEKDGKLSYTEGVSIKVKDMEIWADSGHIIPTGDEAGNYRLELKGPNLLFIHRSREKEVILTCGALVYDSAQERVRATSQAEMVTQGLFFPWAKGESLEFSLATGNLQGDLQISTLSEPERASIRSRLLALKEKHAAAAPPAAEPSETPTPDKPQASDSLEERKKAAQVVATFLAADTLDEKIKYVRFGEKMRPRMEAWHQKHPLQAEEIVEDDLSLELTKRLTVDDMRFIVVTSLSKKTHDYKFFAVEQTADGLKLDWETAVRWQPMALTDFKKGLAKTPQSFRVQSEPGDYYNGPFADETVWQCFVLTYPGDDDFKLYGYVRRDSPIGRRCAEVLEGRKASLILELSLPPKARDNQVLIERVVHEQWFLKDGPLVVKEP